MANQDIIIKNYENAKQQYAEYGVDTEKVLKEFSKIKMSLHCWQGDDVAGFEQNGNVKSENLVTGSYPGKARNGRELRSDIEMAFSQSPLKHKVNIHSMYAEKGSDRKDVTADDFSYWIDWAKEKGYGLDFNGSFFTHPMMNNGFSLASLDKKTRDYWIEVGKGTREISYEIGKILGEKCYNNIWIPDGLKDIPANRFRYRETLAEALDEVLEKEYDGDYFADVVEGKLFGIGVESFTVGSHEFYLGYAASKRNVGVCLDSGHYHPTESVVDKLSAVTPFVKDTLLHISRGVRWDSDHVIVQNDELMGIMQEMRRGNLYGKVAMGLDYFDASINRVAAWTIGLRAAGKAILNSLLEPFAMLDKSELNGDFTYRLALTDEMKNLPVNAVWDYLLMKSGIPVGLESITAVKKYEKEVISAR